MLATSPPLAVDLSRQAYSEVLEDLGMWGFPRRVGTPHQQTIGNPEGFFKWLRDVYGKNVPLFTGHNALAVPGKGEKIDVSLFEFSAAFGDFDTGDPPGSRTPAEVQEEVGRASRWLVEHRIEHAWKASGSDGGLGGFHLKVFFTPERRHRSYLDRWENAFWRGFKHALYLRSINIKCADPTRLERLPFTPYVHKKDPSVKEYKREPNYCVPVPWQLVHEGRFEEIRDLSANPRSVGPVRYRGAPTYRLEALVRMLGWDAFGHEANALHPVPAYTPQGSMFDLNRLYIPRRKCLQILPFGPNPRHAVRLGWVHEIVAVGLVSQLPWGLEELTNFVNAVAEEAAWEDRGNRKTREDQVLYAWRKPYAYNRDGSVRREAFTCKWLREAGVCLGPSCPLFRVRFPEEWAEHVAKHPEAELGAA